MPASTPDSYEAAVQQAASPQEAMRLIAEGIDAILTRLDKPVKRDPWAEVQAAWETPAHPATPKELEAIRNVADLTRHDDLSDLSGEERALVEAARARLANENGGNVDFSLPEGVATRVTEADGETVIELAPVHDDVIRYRRGELAKQMDLDGNLGRYDGEELNDAYVKGGPMWLYLGGQEGRDFIVGLPYWMRRAMVEDVMETSPREADELARDILKARGEEEIRSTLDVTDDNVTNMSGR